MELCLWAAGAFPSGRTAYPTPVPLSMCLYFFIPSPQCRLGQCHSCAGWDRNATHSGKGRDGKASVDSKMTRLNPDLTNEGSITEPSWIRGTKAKSMNLFSTEIRSPTVAQAAVNLSMTLHQSCSCILVIGGYQPHPPMLEFYYSTYDAKHLRSKINTEPSGNSNEGGLKLKWYKIWQYTP